MYRSVARFRQPPFIILGYVQERFTANVDNEIRRGGATETRVDTGSVPIKNDIVQAQVLATNEEESDCDEPGVVDSVESIKANLKWLVDHVDDLSSTACGKNQLKYLNKLLGDRIERYKKAVHSNLSQRHIPTTWGNPDTVFLP